MFHRLLYLISITFVWACSSKPAVENPSATENFNVDELIRSDEYFIPSKEKKMEESDSVQVKFSEPGDLNGDEIPDTISIAYSIKDKRYTLRFSCFKEVLNLETHAEIRVKSVPDMNYDKRSEIVIFFQSEEGCWDEIKLFYLDPTDVWKEKYSGLVYQCSEEKAFSVERVDEHSVLFRTLGLSRDSVDLTTGDTTEYVDPNVYSQDVLIFE